MLRILRFCKRKIWTFAGKIYQKIWYAFLRIRLKNEKISIFSPNCIGGVLYHRLGKKFLSPTINLFFPDKKQYLKFISNLKYYLSLDLVFIETELAYPVAMCGDVEIRFNHYHSNSEANEKWIERKKRVNYENIFLIMDDVKDTDYEDIVKFGKINCKGKVFFTAKKYPEFDYVLPLSHYIGEERVGVYMLEKNEYTGRFPFDKDFDFVKWLNTGRI